MFKKAFTLVELLIVTIIMSILFILLSKAYLLTSSLYVYEINHKNIEKDILFFNQNLQNLADNTEIDYTKYTSLWNTLGFTWVLYLKWWNHEYKLYQSWAQIFLIKDNKLTISLINTWENIVNKLYFKIIPYVDPFKIFQDTNQQPYVTVFLDIKTKYYNKEIWWQNVKYQIQEWFNFRYYN